MNIRLHKNATTTPARRLYIQTSPLSVAMLAAELGVTEDTIRRWKGRDSVDDRSHTAHRLQTTLTPAQEAVVIALRKTLCAIRGQTRFNSPGWRNALRLLRPTG